MTLWENWLNSELKMKAKDRELWIKVLYHQPTRLQNKWFERKKYRHFVSVCCVKNELNVCRLCWLNKRVEHLPKARLWRSKYCKLWKQFCWRPAVSHLIFTRHVPFYCLTVLRVPVCTCVALIYLEFTYICKGPVGQCTSIKGVWSRVALF